MSELPWEKNSFGWDIIEEVPSFVATLLISNGSPTQRRFSGFMPFALWKVIQGRHALRYNALSCGQHQLASQTQLAITQETCDTKKMCSL